MMPLRARLRSFWQSAVHRSDVERHMSDELQFHLARRAEDLMAKGLSLEEANRLARLEFGSVEKYKEEARQSLGLRLLDELRGDVRYALRTFGRSKGFTAAAVATLALGIGANTAIFSLIDAVMLRLLPVDRPEELTLVLRQRPGGKPETGYTNALWEAIRDQQDVFSGVFAWSPPKSFDLAQGSVVQPVRGLMVSGSYFNTLGISPAAGRLLAGIDDRRGCAPLAVLSYGFWQAHFAGAERAVGSTVSLNRQTFEVIGVSAPRFFGVEVGTQFDVAIPLCASALFDKRNLDSRTRWWLNIMGRTKAGTTPDRLKLRLEALSPSIMNAAAAPDQDIARRQRFLETKLVGVPGSAGPSTLRRTFGEPLNMLMAAVSIVLLIACANIASLMLARSTARAKEIAVRTALGASRIRLVRQLLTESVILSSLGAALGLLFARWSSGLLVRNLTTGQNPVFVDLSLDGRILGFTAGVALLTGILVGLLPAVRSTDISLIAAMKSRHTAGGERPSRVRAGQWIVAAQVALSLVLLIGGGLLLRTFVALLTLDMGFDRSNVLVVIAKPPWFAADILKMPPEQRAAAYDEIGRRLRAIPGVLSAARTFTTPIGDDNWMTPISADVRNAPGDATTVYFNFVTPGYFATLRTPLLAGRDFDERDTTTSFPVAIVNEAVSRTFFPGVDAVGRRVRRADGLVLEIVGIVKDSKYESVRAAVPPTVFLPAGQAPRGGEAAEFVVRMSVPPSTLIPSIQRTVLEVSPDIPLEFHTLAQQVDDNLVQERLLAALAGFFGTLALLLAMIGVYGVLSYFVTHRQAEFGIRMALGAQPAAILRLVMRDVAMVTGGGLAAGLAVALVTVKVLQGMLFGLEARDAGTIAAAMCLLSLMALLAGYLPARRATRVDPVIALRSE